MHSIQQDNFVLSASHPVKLPEPIPSDAEGTQNANARRGRCDRRGGKDGEISLVTEDHTKRMSQRSSLRLCGTVAAVACTGSSRQ